MKNVIKLLEEAESLSKKRLDRKHAATKLALAYTEAYTVLRTLLPEELRLLHRLVEELRSSIELGDVNPEKIAGWVRVAKSIRLEELREAKEI